MHLVTDIAYICLIHTSSFCMLNICFSLASWCTVDLSYIESGMKEFEEEDDGFTVDFDMFGYMRDQDKCQRIRSTGVINFDDEDVSCGIGQAIMIPYCTVLGINHCACVYTEGVL